MNNQLIKDLRIGDDVEIQALVVEANRVAFSSAKRAGEFFMKITLSDKSGKIRAVLWDLSKLEQDLQAGDPLFVRGTVNDYHGPQVVISELQPLDPVKVNWTDFQPVSGRDTEEMIVELKTVIDREVQNNDLKQLLGKFVDDDHFFQRFVQAPAARTIHHNNIGGLLEHTLEVVAICRSLAALYPQQIQLDLLLTGAILHDIGKIEEYRQDSLSFEFSDRGKLLGHIIIGKEKLDQKILKLSGFPELLKIELEHMLVSHHGMREWGSPEVPKTIHAFALFHADLVSSRLNRFANVMKNSLVDQGSWTEWDRYLERSIYMPLSKEEDKSD